MSRVAKWRKRLDEGDVIGALGLAPFGWSSGFNDGVFGFTVIGGRMDGQSGRGASLLDAVRKAVAPRQSSAPLPPSAVPVGDLRGDPQK